MLKIQLNLVKKYFHYFYILNYIELSYIKLSSDVFEILSLSQYNSYLADFERRTVFFQSCYICITKTLTIEWSFNIISNKGYIEVCIQTISSFLIFMGCSRINADIITFAIFG